MFVFPRDKTNLPRLATIRVQTGEPRMNRVCQWCFAGGYSQPLLKNDALENHSALPDIGDLIAERTLSDKETHEIPRRSALSLIHGASESQLRLDKSAVLFTPYHFSAMPCAASELSKLSKSFAYNCHSIQLFTVLIVAMR